MNIFHFYLKKIIGKFKRKFLSKFIKNTIVIKKVKGIKYELDLGQVIDSCIFYDGGFELDVSNSLKRLTKPGMNIIDIGANIGCHTLPLAKYVGTAGKVIAFEPMTWARNKLLRNISLNNFENIIVENLAISDKRDTKLLRLKSNWPIDGKFQEDANIKQKIEFETLDNYINSNRINNIGLIKIDVDGLELKVIRGALNLLKICKPTIITEIGYTLRRYGDNVIEMVELLLSMDYAFYSVKTLKKYNNPISVIQSLPHKDNATMNIILK